MILKMPIAKPEPNPGTLKHNGLFRPCKDDDDAGADDADDDDKQVDRALRFDQIT